MLDIVSNLELNSLSLLGKLSGNELKVVDCDNTKYVVFNTYVFTLDNFIALIIFMDTIKECNWIKYSYLAAGGKNLQDLLIAVFEKAESIDTFNPANDKILQSFNNLSKFYAFIQTIMQDIYSAVPAEIKASTKNDVYLSILLHIESLVEDIS